MPTRKGGAKGKVGKGRIVEEITEDVSESHDVSESVDVEEDQWEDDEKEYKNTTTTKTTYMTTTTTRKQTITGRQSLQFGENTKYNPVKVHESHKTKGLESSAVENEGDKVQGIWYGGYKPHDEVSDLWMYKTGEEPVNLKESKHIWWYWGFHPRVKHAPTTTEEWKQLKPGDLIFFPPNVELPPGYEPSGTWTHPMTKADTSHIKEKEAGFVKLAEKKKEDKLDVGGQWKMLYQMPGDTFVKKSTKKKVERNSVIEEKKKTWTLKVVKPDGERVTVKVVPSEDNVLDIKQQVEDDAGIPVKDQRLLYKGKPFNVSDDTMINKTKLKNGDELELDPRINVTVEDVDGNQFQVKNLNPNTSIDKLKDIIEDQEGIPKTDQKLLYNNKPLKDNKTLKDYKIPNDGLITMDPRIDVTVEDHNGNKFPLKNLDPNMTVDEVKDLIEDQEGIPKDDQKLRSLGKPMDDNKTLKDHKIPNNGKLTLDEPFLNLTVEDPDGNTFPVNNVDPNMTVDELKDLIEDQEGIPKDDQRLLYNNKPLKDNKTLKQHGIPNNATLQMDPRLNLTVEDPDGNTFPLKNLDPKMTIDEVKDLIEDQEGIPKQDQKLLYNNKPLKDNKTLKDHGIPNNATIQLDPRMNITVEDPDGNSFPVKNLDPNTTIDQLKDIIEDQEGIPKDDQRLLYNNKPLKDNKTLKQHGIPNNGTLLMDPRLNLTVEDPDGNTFPVKNLDPNMTVDELKDLIEDQEGIPKDDQKLMCNNKPLKDNKTLKDHKIPNNGTLKMDPRLDVTVEDPDGNQFRVKDLDPNTPVDELKDIIEDQEGIPKADQKLIFNGRPMDDDKTLKDHGVPNNGLINMDPRIDLTVEDMDGNPIELKNIDPNMTPDDIKQMVEDETGTPKDEQKLNFKGRPMDNNRSLKDHGVPNNGTLNMDPHIDINVEDPDGNTFQLKNVDRRLPIDNVKDLIEDQEGIPKEDQKLFFNDKPLKDNKTLRDYGVPNNGTLLLDPRINVTVEDPEGDAFQVKNLDPNTPIDELKDIIEKQEGIPRNQQKLMFNNQPMDDDRTLKEHGVPNNGLIKMDPRLDVTVEDPEGNRFQMTDLDPNMSVDKLKDLIEDQEGIPKADQRLVFGGKPLKDHKSLKDSKIPNNGLINMEPMNIFVQTPDGTKYAVKGLPSETVADLQDKVEAKTGIPPIDQNLTYNNKPLNDDTKTLGDVGIVHDSTVICHGPMEVIVKDWKNKKSTFQVRPSDELSTLREKITDEFDLLPKDQYLLHKKQLLRDDTASLADYGIEHHTVLTLDKFKIFVTTPKGKFTQEVDPGYTIAKIQKTVMGKFDIPIKHQGVTYDDTELTAEMTMADIGIGYKETIHVDEIQPPEYKVEMTEWQDPFNYKPKGPVKKKVGVRNKREGVYAYYYDEKEKKGGNSSASEREDSERGGGDGGEGSASHDLKK